MTMDVCGLEDPRWLQVAGVMGHVTFQAMKWCQPLHTKADYSSRSTLVLCTSLFFFSSSSISPRFIKMDIILSRRRAGVMDGINSMFEEVNPCRLIVGSAVTWLNIRGVRPERCVTRWHQHLHPLSGTDPVLDILQTDALDIRLRLLCQHRGLRSVCRTGTAANWL